MSQKTKIGSASASIAVLDVSMGWGQREERATRLDAVDTGEEYSDESRSSVFRDIHCLLSLRPRNGC